MTMRLDNFSKYNNLRVKFPWFSYESYRYYYNENTLTAIFTFSISGKISFSPQITIPFKKGFFRPYETLSAQALDNLVFHAGMIELVSYWKAACPPQVIIKPNKLSGSQLNFWKKIYYLGLGEFFYLNSINATEDDFMEITCQADNAVMPFHLPSSGNCLLPVGGGKDSAVSMGLLNEGNFDWIPMIVNPGKTTRDVIEAAGKHVEETVDITRQIDPHLLKLNGKGFLNGHTPFSAALAFYSLLASYLTGRTDIILSNESSANEATVPGTNINHQYSKTLEFEEDFRDYCREYISTGFNYFSLLRPLSEIQIAKVFSGMPEFHQAFRSCNAGSKTGTWCGKCPKCLFTFIILSPFLPPDSMIHIFGKNLLDDPTLEETYRQLSGKAEIKPFECIGTVDEVNLAMDKVLTKYPGNRLPFLLKKYHEQRPAIKDAEAPDELMNQLTEGHFVPENYLTLLKKML